MDGTTIWSFKDDTVIANPRGIAVEDMENVYITNGDQNNVTVISPDRTQSKQLLSQADGLKIPTATQYDRKQNRLLVANYVEKAFLFDISYLNKAII
ncbi:Hypothetical predicted protein [Mytilus galloprovincialis]|uniref:Uncharacterized protein n=1 Tax=Mytilus galloprovincialis TaxID=29158 RepID=A0A8B6FIC0_MYTGA|nr:Hypothetical predicted protein [Mytilus galloprovincialis]